MGQYYKPVSLTSDKKRVKGYIYSHDIKWSFKRDDGKKILLGTGLKLMEHSYIGNKMMLCVERLLIPGGEWHKTPIVWAGDYANPEEETGLTLYEMTESAVDGEHISVKYIPKPLTAKEAKEYRYIVNHTKGEFVDKQSVPSNDGWKIHPLSLLTSSGNGRGGGDFRGENIFVGTWAKDIISIGKEIPEGFKEIIPNFK